MNPRMTIDSGAGGSSNVTRRPDLDQSRTPSPSTASSKSPSPASSSSTASSSSSAMMDLTRRTDPPQLMARHKRPPPSTTQQNEDFEHEEFLAGHSEHLERASTPDGFDGKYFDSVPSYLKRGIFLSIPYKMQAWVDWYIID